MRLKKQTRVVDAKQMRRCLSLFLCAVTFGVLASSCGTSSSDTAGNRSSIDLVSNESSGATRSNDDDSYISDDDGYIELEEDIERVAAAIGRADLRIDSVQTGDSNGFQITASVTSLDKSFIIAPVIRVEPSDGVTITIVPSGCEAISTGYACSLESFGAGTFPQSSEPITFELTVDLSAIDPQISLIVTSKDNPVSNDPDPINNTTTHILT